MKLILKFCCFLCILLILPSCSSNYELEVNRIVPPVNYNIPVQGTWEIKKCMNRKLEPVSPEEKANWNGKTVEFAKDGVRFGDLFWDKPGYKIKVVDTQEYFLYNYRVNGNTIGVDDKETSVISVTSGEKFLYEFIVIGPDEMIMDSQDKIFLLRKVSGDVSDELNRRIHENQLNEKDIEIKKGKPVPVCVLLGVKTPKASSGNSVKEYSYRTLLVAWDKEKLHPVYQLNSLLMPRKDGFWKVQVCRNTTPFRVEDRIYAYKVGNENLVNFMNDIALSDFWKDKQGQMGRSIMYAGNDYICTEVSGSGKYVYTGAAWEKSCFQTLPVDNLQSMKGVKISDILGTDGSNAMKKDKEKFKKALGQFDENSVDEIDEEENFTLFRKSGYWFFKGRLSYLKDNKFYYSDYMINRIPPTKLVFYDTLAMQWTKIKDRIPDATDAFTSPNTKLAVIKTTNKLLLYSIDNNKLSEIPLGKVKLNNSDSIIMAEWATEDYVKNWENVFIENGAFQIDITS